MPRVHGRLSERPARPARPRRSNYILFGEDNGRHAAAVLFGLDVMAERNGRDPFACLRVVIVIGRISDHPSNRLAELLPDNWKPPVPPPAPVFAGRLRSSCSRGSQAGRFSVSNLKIMRRSTTAEASSPPSF